MKNRDLCKLTYSLEAWGELLDEQIDALLDHNQERYKELEPEVKALERVTFKIWGDYFENQMLKDSFGL